VADYEEDDRKDVRILVVMMHDEADGGAKKRFAG
jgi:hypothetical protein